MSVKQWGIGRPDYHMSTVSSRPVLITTGDTQVRVLINKRYTIAAGATSIDVIYTVPSGYSLSLGGGHISVKDSCINKLRLVTPTDELIGEYRYDMRGDLSMAIQAGQEISENVAITAYVSNNDAIESSFSLMITGVLNKT